MVEQNARQALEIADRGFVLVQGRNAYTDSGVAPLANPEVRRAFLGDEMTDILNAIVLLEILFWCRALPMAASLLLARLA